MEEEFEVGTGITPDEFALKIKDKYPEYQNVDNTVLVTKMLEKYPQYKDKVITSTPQQTKGVPAEENGGLQSTSADMVESSSDSNLVDPTKPKPKTNQITPTKEVGGRQKLDINVIKDFEQQAQELASLPDRGMAYKNEASRQIQDEYAKKGVKNFNISPEEVDDRAFTLMRQDKVKETENIIEEQQKEEEEYNFWEDTWKKVKANASTAVEGIAGIPNLVSKGLFYTFADEDDMKFVNSLKPEAREAFINSSLGGLGNAQFAQASADTQQYFKEISQAIQKEIHQFDTNITDDLSNGDYSKAGKRIASEGIGSIPSIIQSMIPYVGLASIAGGTAANKQEELEDEGYDLSGKSLSNSVINGASEALFEMVTAKLGSKLYKTLGEAPAAGREAIIQSMVDNLVKAPLAEGASEGATTLVQDLSDKFIQGKEKEFQQIFKDVVDSSLVGAAVGGGLGASTLTLERTKAVQEDVSINKVINSESNNYSSVEDAFKGDMKETSLDQLILASKSSMTNKLDSALNKQVEAGTMNESEAANIRLNLAKTQLSLSKTMGIPMDNASRVEAVNLINQKEDLKDQIKNMDDALAIPKKEQLKQIDARLSEIASGKPTTDEKVNTSTEPTENVTENQEASSTEGSETTSENQTNDTQVTEEKPTRKAKNVQDLETINKEVFGLDEEQSKASSVIMDQLIGTMAERSGVEKSEIYDKLDFNKGDQSTFEDLSEKGKALFQIAGENANLKQGIRDNLSVARQMEESSKTPKEIRLATGWEKGVDGKWGYEMDSSKASLKRITPQTETIGEALNFEELFEAYPELKDITLQINNNMRSIASAMVESNRIAINPSRIDTYREILPVLLHELQHFIQKKEGFARGGNPRQVRIKLEEAIAKKPSYVSKLKEIKDLLFGTNSNIPKAFENLNSIKDILKKSDFDLYESLAGEVQARNVETRQGMTPKERRNTLLSETEDVARDEQVILFQEGKGAAEIGQDGQAIIHALTNPDVSTPLHELAHVYEGYLSESEKNDILEWSGQEEWNRETSENFARGFEKYLSDGIAPNEKLQGIFDNFKKWLTNIYNGIKGSEIDLQISPKMQSIFDSMVGTETAQNVVDVLNTRTQEIIDGEGDSEFKIRKLLGGVPVLSYLDDVWYRNISKRVDSSTAKFVKNALDSNNKVVRVIGQTATNWFNGLPRTVEELSNKRQLKGKQEVAFIVGEEMTKNLNQLINFSVESAERVHKVLDPELYNEEERISLEDLNQEEKQLYDQLKDINAKTHELNYKEGFIDKETYEKYKDNYIGRAYEPYENLSGEVDEKGEFIDSKIMDKIYKQRKSIDEWKQENKITDPIYLTVNRMVRTERNMAVKAYADGISKDSKLSSTEPKEGYVELKGKKYGSLDGKYVPHYIAEDFKGFSFTNKYMDAIYDGVKGYDKLKARQFLKKYHTVYSPLVQVGNFMSNHAFAFASGINLPELWGNLPEASKSIKSKDSDYKTLVENGILGSDVITSDFTALTKEAQEREVLKKDKEGKKTLMNFLKKADEKATDLYSHSDDVMKMSAYKALRKQGYNEREAVERVFDGFQNYSTVGKAWDFAAKTPVVGNAYVKFQADLMRIMKNAVIKRPLSTAAFLGSVRLITMMTSMMSGEDDEKRKIREARGFIPKINLGFTEIPLVAKVGGKEVNLARYLAPYYEYDIPNKDWLSSASRFAPFQFQVSENAEKGQAGVSIETPDVLLGGLFQAFAQNRDFRNKSISDPTATRYTESGLDSDEKTFNKLNYVARSVVPMYSTAQDAYLSAMYGEDFYGRTKSVSDNFISKVVKIETYGDKELEKTINRQIKSFDFEQKAVNDKLKSIKKAFQKDMIELEDKVDEGVLDPEKASRKQEKLEKEYERKQNKYLDELVKIQEKFNEYVDKTDAIQLNTDY